MQATQPNTRCPKCGTELSGNPDHCPICQYIFTRNLPGISVIPVAFIASVSLSSALTALIVWVFRATSGDYFISNPFFIIPGVVLLPGLISSRRYYLRYSGKTYQHFSSESTSSLVSAILMIFLIILGIFLVILEGAGWSGSNLVYLGIVTLITFVADYVFLAFLAFFAVTVYGIIKIGKMAGNKVYVISAYIIILGGIISNLPVLVGFLSQSLEAFIFSGQHGSELLYITISGYLLICVFSAFMLFQDSRSVQGFSISDS